MSSEAIADLPYDYVQPIIALPIVGVMLSTWLASWVGSRRVLDVTPMQAIGGAQELSLEVAKSRRGRSIAAITTIVLGIVLLGLGIVVGLDGPIGILPAALGGIVSFTGVVLGAQFIMPPALRLVGRLFGRGASARLAAENAVRYPERSARGTIGLVIGVTLVTTFAVASASYQATVIRIFATEPGEAEQVAGILLITVVIFSVLLGFSALLAAVGMVNNLSLSVLQRTRELGLLRALGFTSRQLRSMITLESIQLTVTAVVFGLVLGVVYGWAGAQSLLASVRGVGGFVIPVVPVWILVAVVLGSALLSAAASLGPTRRVTGIAPITALAAE